MKTKYFLIWGLSLIVGLLIGSMLRTIEDQRTEINRLKQENKTNFEIMQYERVELPSPKIDKLKTKNGI